MKTLRGSIVCLVVLLSTLPLLRAQDLSKYRHFTLGMSLTNFLERTEQKISNVKTIHGRPALIQRADLVAAECRRDFAQIGQRRTDSLFFLQWRALQDFGDLRSTCNRRTN
jgi:hypothetical protein